MRSPPSQLSRFVGASLLVASVHCAAAVVMPPGRGEIHLPVQSGVLAGVRHGEAAAFWTLLSVGDRLELSREPDNPFDRRAIRVDWAGRRLGYVPRRDNETLAWALDRGDPLRARISGLVKGRRGARRIEFEVFLE